MRKWIYGVLACVFGAAFFAAIAVALINWRDEKIRPEIESILANRLHTTEDQERAWFYVLGVHAGDDEDPEQKGRDLWAKREAPGFWDALNKSRPFATSFSGCKSVCGTEALEKDPRLQEALRKYPREVRRYVRLMQYGAGVTLFRGDEKNPLLSLTALPYNAHPLFLAQLAEWLKKGGEARVLDLLVASNTYMESIMSNGSLLERLVAARNAQMNAQFLMLEMWQNPELRVTEEIVATFPVPESEKLLRGALEEELRTVHNAVRSIQSLSDFELSHLSETNEWGPKISSYIPARALFKPNQAMNRYYDIAMQGLYSDCPLGEEIEVCVPAAKWASLNPVWHWIENPLGRGLVRILTVNLSGRRHTVNRLAEEIISLKQEMRRAL